MNLTLFTTRGIDCHSHLGRNSKPGKKDSALGITNAQPVLTPSNIIMLRSQFDIGDALVWVVNIEYLNI